MKYFYAIALILVSLLNNRTTFAQEKKLGIPKPNIVIFLVDDMGWQDTSLPFYKEKTK